MTYGKPYFRNHANFVTEGPTHDFDVEKESNCSGFFYFCGYTFTFTTYPICLNFVNIVLVKQSTFSVPSVRINPSA